MALTTAEKDQIKELLNNLNLGTQKAGIGDLVVDVIERLEVVEEIEAGGTIPAATTSVRGGVKKAAAVADIADTEAATAEDVAVKLNALLASLRDAGTINT